MSHDIQKRILGSGGNHGFFMQYFLLERTTATFKAHHMEPLPDPYKYLYNTLGPTLVPGGPARR